MPRPALALLVLVACVAAAGCGSATKTSATSATIAPEPTVSPGSVSTAAPPTTTTSATTTAASAGPARCATAELSAKEGGGEAGLGNRSTVYLLTNVGAAPCHLDGYPGMAFLSATGRVLLGTVQRGNSYLFNDPGPSEVDLAPGESASFGLGWSVPNGRACTWSTSVEITPPDDRDHLTIASRIAICPGDTPTVSAVVAGTRGPH